VAHRVRRSLVGLARGGLIDVFVEAVEELRSLAPDAEALGFGVPSVIDRERGLSVMSVHLPLDDVAFGDLMRERTGLPVAWDNDANLAMLAEHRAGAARGARNAVLLTLGTGIGGGLVVDGHLYRGSSGAGAELGHIVVDVHGPPCQGGCPGRGCLEVMASGTAMGRLGARAAMESPRSGLGRAAEEGRPVTGVLVTELALAGDAAAVRVMEEVGESLGAGLVSLVNTFNPDVVVIGGGAAAARDLILTPARAVLAERGLRPGRDQVKVVPAHFAEEAGMMGAAMLALDQLPADA
jgi:glucokinase